MPRSPGRGPSGVPRARRGWPRLWVRRCVVQGGTQGSGGRGPRRAAGSGSGPARAGGPSCAPPPRRPPPQRSEPPSAAGLPPAPPPLSPPLPSLSFFSPAISLSAWPSPVEVSGSLSVWGVGLPHCFGCFSVLLRLVSPACCLSRSGSLSRALSRPLPLSVSPDPPPASPPTSPPSLRLSISGQLSVPLIVPAPLELLSEPLCVPVSPGLFQLPRRALGLGHPLPLLSNNEKPVRPENPSPSPREWSTPSSSPRRLLGSPGTPPGLYRASEAATTLRQRGGGRNRKANFSAGGDPGITFQPRWQLEAATPPG